MGCLCFIFFFGFFSASAVSGLSGVGRIDGGAGTPSGISSDPACGVSSESFILWTGRTELLKMREQLQEVI